jgi:hypothetical protein
MGNGVDPMARPKMPEESKKKQISLTLPSGMYDFLKSQPSASAFVETLIEPHMPKKKKSTKAKSLSVEH